MKDIFEWSEVHSVGVQQFDSDHRRLLELAHTLVSEKLRGMTYVTTGEVLNDLETCAAEHFAHEERLLATVNYPGLEEHSLKHKRLLEEIDAYKKAIDSGRITTEDVARFVAVWIFQHIEEEDQKYRDTLNAHGYR